ncbi:ZWILCH [Bugula neritina]|uniref:Protein zwilch n=1 Tax=Bugula neritina TaxID=10212 RepID=A0A7J7JRK0_BUGNE|nr:ZWILCH [Bugula neritina]
MYSVFLDTLYQTDCKVEPQNTSVRSTLVSVQIAERLDNILPLVPKNLEGSAILISATDFKQPKQVALSRGSDDSFGGSDCIGSPLKIESCVNYEDVDRQISQTGKKVRVLHLDRPNVYPLSYSKAIEFMSAAKLERSNDLNRPLVCVCNPLDNRDHVMALGTFRKESSRLLFSLHYQEVPSHDLRNKSMLRSLISECSSTIPEGNILTRAKAEYHLMSTCSNLLRENLSAEEVNAYSSHSAVTVCAEWNGIDSLLQTPPPDTVASLKLKVVNGDRSSMVYSIYEELEYLKNLVSSLRSGKTSWPEVERSVIPIELTRKLLKSPVYEDEGLALPGDTTIQVNSIDPRKNLDFTDRLWSILMGCQSYSELLEVMECIVNSVSSRSCQPLMVSQGNTNPLAKWIYSQQAGHSEPSSNHLDFGSLQALIYFIEVGLEKLTKDYVHTYLGSFGGLVTPDKLECFTKQTVSVQERLNNLYKLHTVLELSALLHSFLRLPLTAVRSATSAALQHLSTHTTLPQDGLQLSTSIANLSDIIHTQSPETWEAVIGGEEGPSQIFVKICKSEPEHGVVLPLVPTQKTSATTLPSNWSTLMTVSSPDWSAVSQSQTFAFI